MGSSRFSLKRSLLLSAAAALSLFSATALAQGNQQTTGTTNGNGNGRTTTAAATATTAGDTTATTSPKGQTETTTNLPKISTSSPDLPPLSSSTKAAGDGKLTDLPTLSKTVDNSVPTYPPPSPPPVGNAPFMNRSTLPDGTVFICVGAILGVFGAAILLWRGIVAYLLKRSVERAAMAHHNTNDKVAASFPAPPDTFYKYTDVDSSPSLAAGIAAARGQRRTHRGPTPSATPSTTNLFYSPTAAGGTAGMNTAGGRDSRFLPAGFYAATSAAPAQAHGQSVSLSNLGPTTRGQAVRATPPESPDLAPRTTPPGGRNFSTSSISLNRPPSGRAPSVYLDDLLGDNPGAFPPAAPQGGGTAGHYRSYSNGRQQQPRY